jgi:hypothetical protein
MLGALLGCKLLNLLVLHYALEETEKFSSVAHALEEALELSRKLLVGVSSLVLDDARAILNDFAQLVTSL